MALRPAALAPARPRSERISSLGVIVPPPIHVEATAFSGSLSMLFQCVHERKVDLMAIPLFPICRAYFEYVMANPDGGVDEAAAAMMALSYMLERKAWGLLPTPEPEPEADDDLPLTLPSAHEYAIAIESLRLWHSEREQLFFRPTEGGPDPYELPMALGDVTPNDLARAFERLLQRATPEPVRPLNKPRRSLSEQMGIVFRALTTEWRNLDTLVPTPFTREDAVYWFLALLELIRLGQAVVQIESGDVRFARRHGS